ncbi:Golgi phosphoprotein 3 (GPP34) OS=Streptomyces microflavus OX=1919 GN=Smic_08570 PE=4 SV=1 [Streptomyces microflavus]
MNQHEPDFLVLEYITVTKDPRTGLVVAIGGTQKAADILQRTGGFLSAAGHHGTYHRLPHGLPVEQQRLKATTASHALLAAGHNVHLDPALDMLPSRTETAMPPSATSAISPSGFCRQTSSQVAEVLTEIAAPVNGLLPLTREVVVRAALAARALEGTPPGDELDHIDRLGDITHSMSMAARVILHARNHTARAPQKAPTPPPSTPRPPGSRRR